MSITSIVLNPYPSTLTPSQRLYVSERAQGCARFLGQGRPLTSQAHTAKLRDGGSAVDVSAATRSALQTSCKNLCSVAACEVQPRYTLCANETIHKLHQARSRYTPPEALKWRRLEARIQPEDAAALLGLTEAEYREREARDDVPTLYRELVDLKRGELGLLSEAWAGFQLVNGKLFPPDYARGFAPERILAIHWLQESNSALRAELRKAGRYVPEEFDRAAPYGLGPVKPERPHRSQDKTGSAIRVRGAASVSTGVSVSARSEAVSQEGRKPVNLPLLTQRSPAAADVASRPLQSRGLYFAVSDPSRQTTLVVAEKDPVSEYEPVTTTAQEKVITAEKPESQTYLYRQARHWSTLPAGVHRRPLTVRADASPHRRDSAHEGESATPIAVASALGSTSGRAGKCPSQLASAAHRLESVSLGQGLLTSLSAAPTLPEVSDVRNKGMGYTLCAY